METPIKYSITKEVYSLETKRIKATNKKGRNPKKETSEKTVPTFRFFLRDGTQIDTLEGVVVPVNEKTETAYRMLADLN